MQKEKVNNVAKTPVVKAEVKEAVAETTKKVKTAAKDAVKETAKKTESVKKSVKKAAVKKESQTNVVVQVLNQEFSLSDLENKVKTQFVADGHRAGCIKLLEIYAKPEEGKAYYVVNEGKFTGSVDL
jgi:chromatin remodeling complex protein RSC6